MQDMLRKAIDAVKAGPKTTIKGKEYATVATRVEAFRLYFGLDYGIATDAFDTPDMNVVRVRACIIDPARDGAIIATGWAEEDKTQGKINQTSALENAETSAIGRALANLGLAGSEYASLEEIAVALTNQAAKPADKMSTAQRNQPVVSQYQFYIPPDDSKESIDQVFYEIDGITDQQTLTAYYYALEPMLSRLFPPDVEEIMATFKARSQQMKG